MSYQAPEEEVVLFRQGRGLLKAAAPIVSQIGSQFTRLGTVIQRLDSRNGDILDKQLGLTGEDYAETKIAAHHYLVEVQSFLTVWGTLKTQLAELESPEVQQLIAAMVASTAPPVVDNPIEPEPTPE